MSATAATSARREVLVVKGLSAGYGPMRVIHDLDLVAHSGERIGLVGLNGHGKSTLFYAIAGLTDWQRGSIDGGFRHRKRKVARKLLSFVVVATAAVSELSTFRGAMLT